MIRAAGALLILMSMAAMFRIHELVTHVPARPATAGEVLLSIGATIAGMAGMALAFIGPALFRPYHWPPRNHAPGSDWWKP